MPAQHVVSLHSHTWSIWDMGLPVDPQVSAISINYGNRIVMSIVCFFKEANWYHHSQLFCKFLHPAQHIDVKHKFNFNKLYTQQDFKMSFFSVLSENEHNQQGAEGGPSNKVSKSRSQVHFGTFTSELQGDPCKAQLAERNPPSVLDRSNILQRVPG